DTRRAGRRGRAARRPPSGRRSEAVDSRLGFREFEGGRIVVVGARIVDERARAAAVLVEQIGDELVIGRVRDEGAADLARLRRPVREMDDAVDLGCLTPPTALEEELGLLVDAVDEDFELGPDPGAELLPAD